MKRQLSLLVSSLFFFVSCDQKNKLSEEDYLWMPYVGNESLVFKANTGGTDTFFILKKDTLWAYPQAQAFAGIEYEVVTVLCKSSSLNQPGSDRRYDLFKVQKAKDNRAELVFDLLAKGAEFYRLTAVKIDSLSKIKPVTLQTSYGQYDDVYIISHDDFAKDFYNRSNFVTKLYWSKSSGLIRYDKKDSVYWELLKN